MPTEYLDFTLAIQGKPGDYTVHAHGPGGVLRLAPFVYPDVERVQALLERIEQHDAPLVNELAQIGSELYQALLPPPIRDALIHTEARLPEQTGLRLKLAGQPLELARLPWELLYDPAQHAFLLHRSSTSLVRHVETGRPVPPLKAEVPLRVLHVQANPAGSDWLALEASRRAIRDALGEVGIVTELPAATPETVRRELRQAEQDGRGYHVLHFDGHGTWDAGEGFLFLQDEEGNHAPVAGRKLADWLDGTSVRLVVLAACKSGMTSDERPFSGVAHQLMAASALPAVIAMQFAIEDTAATRFNSGFYVALADGSPVDAAMVEGRQQILDEAGHEERSVAWAAPVLFMRTQSGEVLAPRGVGVPSRKERDELEARYREAVVERWQYIEEGDEGKVPLTNVFVMLQALDATRRTPRELRADLADTAERLAEAGLQLPEERHSGKEPPQPPLKPIPLFEALQKEQHLLLLAEPGAGKSTTLRFIALCFARPGEAQEKLGLDEERLPLLVHLRELAILEQGFRLEETLVTQVMRLGPDEAQARHLLDRWLREGRLALLLDGLDEVPSEERESLRQEIRRFATSPEGKRCRIVVSSRLAGYQDLHPFKEYQLKPFEGARDAQPYVSGWLAALCGWEPERADKEAAHLLEEMSKRPALKRLVNNPLLLRLAVSLYARSSEIAQNRTLLYRRYIDDSIWPGAKARAREIPDQEMVRRALEVVAWALQVRGPQREAQLEGTLREQLPEAQDPRGLLAFLREQMGLLARYPVQAEWFLVFSHLTFQEYFVAERLARWWHEIPGRTWAFLHPRLHHPAWHESLLLLAAALPTHEATDLMRHVLLAHSRYESTLHRDLRLVLEMTQEGAGTDTQDELNLTSHLQLLLSRGSWARRERIIQILGQIGGPQAIAALEWTFTAKSAWLLRSQAAKLLGQIGDARAIPALLQVLSNQDFMIQAAAVEALGQIGDPRAIPALKQTFTDQNSEVREGAAEALGRIGDPQVLPVLIQEISDDESEVRGAAAQALGDIGDAQAVPMLLQALTDERYWVRMAVAVALGQIGDPRALPILTQALMDEDVRVRWIAAGALGQIGAPLALPALMQALTDTTEGTKMAAVMALEKIGAPALPSLLVALTRQESGVRRTAAKALGKIRDGSALPALLNTLADRGYGVRVAAVEALGQIGDPRAIPALVDALAHKDHEVRRAAVEALGNIGNDSFLPILLNAFTDEEREVRQAAAEALGKIGDAQAVPILLQSLGNAEGWVQEKEAVVEALGEIGDPRALPALLQMLADNALEVRLAAIRALGQIADAKAIPALIQRLEDRDSRLRAAAVEALGQIGDTQVIPVLLQELTNEKFWIRTRQAQLEAIRSAGEAQSAPLLIRALTDKDSGVRQATETVLELLLARASIEQLQQTIHSLQRRAAKLNQVGEIKILRQAVTRLSELEVAALPPGDPTTTPPLPFWHGNERLIAIAAAVALLTIAIALLPPGPVAVAAWIALAVMVVALIVEGVRWWRER